MYYYKYCWFEMNNTLTYTNFFILLDFENEARKREVDQQS